MSQDAGEQVPVEVLADEFIDRQRRGERPTIDDYVRDYPDLADEIREVFPAIAAMEGIKSDWRRSVAQQQSPVAGPITQLGDFRLIREIGRGGMGVVYEAEQNSLQRRVALKLLPRQTLSDPDRVRRFEREARTAAGLHHTNIVPVFGAGEQDGYHYLVMQLIDGIGLDRMIDRLQVSGVPELTQIHFDVNDTGRDEVAFGEVVDGVLQNQTDGMIPAEPHWPAPGMTTRGPSILASLADASAQEPFSIDDGESQAPPSAHPHDTRNLVFQDDVADGDPDTNTPAAVTPIGPTGESALPAGKAYWRTVARIGAQVADALHHAHTQGKLHRDVKPGNLLLDTDGVAWVTDFGLARATDGSDASQSGHLAGTLCYMAPEQFRGQVEERTDQYGLGLTLYELTTLQPAFADGSRAELIRRITESRPPNPRSINSNIPADLETIVLKAIAPEPQHRYPTTEHLAADLRRFLDDVPIEARRVMPHERFWRWCRRNPAIAALSCLAGVLLVLVASLTTVGYVRESAQRERMEVTLGISLDALDRVYRRFSSDRIVATSRLQFEGSDGETIELPIQSAVSRETADMLGELLTAYDRLAHQNSDNMTLRSEAAKAARRVGDIHQMLGEFDQATQAYEDAIERYTQLEDETGSRYTADIAKIYNELGNTYRASHQTDQADAAYRRARETLESAIDGADGGAIHSAAPRLRYELARTCYFLGKRIPPESRMETPLPPGAPGRGPNDRRGPERPPGGGFFRPGGPPLRRGFQPGPARRARDDVPPTGVNPALLNRALSILEGLNREFPSISEYRYLMAMCHRELTPLMDSAQPNRAVEILEELVEQYPAVADYRFQLAETYASVDMLRLASGDDGDAEERLRKALTHADTLASQHPNVTDYIQSRAHMSHKLAEVINRSLVGDGSRPSEPRRDDAIHFGRQAVQLKASIVQQFPDSVTNRMWLGVMRGTLARLLRDAGQDQDAVDVLKASVADLDVLGRRKDASWFVDRRLYEQNRMLAEMLHRTGDHQRARDARQVAEEYRLMLMLPDP